MKDKLSVLSIFALGLGLGTTANATLFDRSNGLIYDSDQDLTWLQDASYAQTSGYDADGLMRWDNAMAWADNLLFGGYDDWRLAGIADTGAPGCDFSFNGTDCGFNVDTANSELAYMWYENLGNIAFWDSHGNGPQAGGGLTSTSADGVDLLNLQPDFYWSATEFALDTQYAWYFNTANGSQDHGSVDWGLKGDEFYAWAVRSGDVDTTLVPEPGMLLTLVAGLAGVVSVRRRYR